MKNGRNMVIPKGSGIPDLSKTREPTEAELALMRDKALNAASISPEWKLGDGRLGRWRMCGNKVLVAREEAKHEGRLVLPANAAEEKNVAIILDVGPDVADQRIWPGARALIGEWGGTKVTLDSREMFVLDDSEILGLLQAGAERPPLNVEGLLPDATPAD